MSINPKINGTLRRLHREARIQLPAIIWNLRKGIFRKLNPEDMESVHISIGPKEGMELYRLVKERNCKTIVEFGTSFGISTIYLGAGALETGGRVITTEILSSKADKARKHFDQAGLSSIIDLRVGDALKTLKHDPLNIDLFFLDGWNDLYLPLLKLLEPRFKSNCVIVVDNVNMNSTADFLDYINSNPSYRKLERSVSSGRTLYLSYDKIA